MLCVVTCCAATASSVLNNCRDSSKVRGVSPTSDVQIWYRLVMLLLLLRLLQVFCSASEAISNGNAVLVSLLELHVWCKCCRFSFSLRWLGLLSKLLVWAVLGPCSLHSVLRWYETSTIDSGYTLADLGLLCYVILVQEVTHPSSSILSPITLFKLSSRYSG